MSTPDLTPPGPPIEPVATPMPGAAQPYGQPQPPMPWGYGVPLPVVPPRSPRGLAIATLVLACAIEALFIGYFLTSGSAERAFDSAAARRELPPYTVLDVLMVLYLPVLLAAYVVTCVWLMQARKFATIVRPGDPHTHRAAWVWFGWWVPFVSFVFPYTVVRDIRRASRPALSGTGFVVFWWLSWLATLIGIQVLSAMVPDGQTVRTADGLQVAAAVLAGIGAVALAAWISVIRDISSGQLEQEREVVNQGSFKA